MAEATLFSTATNLLSTLASPALGMAYERGRTIWEAKDELAKLGSTIEAVQAVLLDAEKKQDGSATVKLWITRVRDVLFDADDLFDEVTTNDQLKQQMMSKHKHSGKVRVFGSRLNPIVSRDSIAKRVKAIRKSLDQIREDMAPFKFVQCLKEEPVYGVRKGRDEGHFVDPKMVVGREYEKKVITEFLFGDSYEEQNISVVAIVGIGGMRKTTVAQLVYNDGKVEKKFGKRRWWACISDITDEKEVLGRIFKAMTDQSFQDLNVSQLQSKIVESVISGEAFLLVLDDLWDSDHNRWVGIKSLLDRYAKGSKIIATTREDQVSRAIDAVKTHRLGDLSPEKSWELFKKFAFTREQENDPEWMSVGKEVVKKCAGVPLAIRSIASILRGKTTIEEWVSFKSNELSKIELSDNPIMSALKLSYDYLSSDLKQCFAYCSLFEKDSLIWKRDLIYLWAAQGYLQTNNESCTVEEVGHAYFMELLRRSFFQEIGEDEATGEILCCKMHDLVHDLAQLMAGDQSIIVSRETDQLHNITRHVSVCFDTDGSWEALPPLLGNNRLRSFLVMNGGSPSSHVLHQRFKKFKFLRALDLKILKMEEVSGSIGELIHLRYLNLSHNGFKSLPESITELLNLISLNLDFCWELEALPKDFRKLINLRHLDTRRCGGLKYMPDGFGELTSLQHLGYFKVGHAPDGGGSSKLDALLGLKLKGSLEIKYDDDYSAGGWTEDELVTDFSTLAASLKELKVSGYRGMKILVSAPNLVRLSLSHCFSFNSIPPLSSFACLKSLKLESISELEYFDDMGGATEGAGSSGVLFFPCLEKLELHLLNKFKGAATTADKKGKGREHPDHHHHGMLSFPRLSDLQISFCPELKAMPLSPRLRYLFLSALGITGCEEIVSLQGEALTSLQIWGCKKLKSVKLAPPHLNVLEQLQIWDCPKLMMNWGSLPNLRKLELFQTPQLESFMGEALTSLSFLSFEQCNKLKKVKLAPADVNALQELRIGKCPDLELIEENQTGIDWDSLPNLRKLRLFHMPQLESFMGEALTSLSSLSFDNCRKLKKVRLAPVDVNALQELEICGCPALELWEENKRGIDWDSLPNLRKLRTTNGVSDAEKFPTCLQNRRTHGNLIITDDSVIDSSWL